jgi:hypothetical protein
MSKTTCGAKKLKDRCKKEITKDKKLLGIENILSASCSVGLRVKSNLISREYFITMNL